MTGDRYLDVDMPEAFVLEFMTPQGTWMDEGWYMARAFQRLPDGMYVCSLEGTLQKIRCVEKLPDGSFIHLDGGGERHHYRLVPSDWRPSGAEAGA